MRYVGAPVPGVAGAPTIRYWKRKRVVAVSALATVVSTGGWQWRVGPVATSPVSGTAQIRLSTIAITPCQPLYSACPAPATKIVFPTTTGEAAPVPVRRIVLSASRAPVALRRLTSCVIDPTCTVTVSPLRAIRRAASETDVSVACEAPWPARVCGATLPGTERGRMTAVIIDPPTRDPATAEFPPPAGVPGGTVASTPAGVVVPGDRSARRYVPVSRTMN